MNLLSQFVTVVIQLGSVPIFISYWGVSQYGEWLILSAISSYLAVADMGLSTAAANEMTAKKASGQDTSALRTFQSAWVFVTALTVGLGLLAILLIWTLATPTFSGFEALSDHDARMILTFLVAQLLAVFQCNLMNAGFRSNGEYALGVAYTVAIRFVEFLAAAFAVILGAGPVAVAIIYALVRASGFVTMKAALARRATWLKIGWSECRASTLRRLARPALAFMAIPSSNALRIQGMVILVGYFLGASYVTIFSVVRTLVNVIVQFVQMINRTVWPEITVAFSRGDHALARELHHRACSVAIWGAGIGTIVVALFGQRLITAWTQGNVDVGRPLLYTMLLTVVLNALWSTSSVVHKAVNRPQGLAVATLLMSIVAIICATALVKCCLLVGVALSLVVFELGMSAYVVSQSARMFGEPKRLLLTEIFSSVPTMLRAWIASRRL